MPFSRREAMKVIALSGVGAALGVRVEAAENGSRPGRLRLVCVEEHVNSPAVVHASMPEMLRKAPYLVDWGKDVTDRGESDASRPRVIAAGDSLRKLTDMGEGRLRVPPRRQAVDVLVCCRFLQPRRGRPELPELRPHLKGLWLSWPHVVKTAYRHPLMVSNFDSALFFRKQNASDANIVGAIFLEEDKNGFLGQAGDSHGGFREFLH